MASLGHVAVGMAAARWESKQRAPLLNSLFASMVWYAGLSLLPDLDVLGFRYGIAYEHEWGHRGASHSFAFAALLALAVALLASALKRPFRRSLGLAFLVIASHGLLDAMTDAAIGPALLWPWDHARMLLPMSVIPVAPLGRQLLSARGAYVMIVELGLFAPFWIYALWPEKKRVPAPEKTFG